MNEVAALASGLHVLSAVIWVGGMFFAYMVLRPSLGSFEPPQRLGLWDRVFKKFFLWVWHAVVLLLITGYFMLFGVYGGFAQVRTHIHIMHLLGLIMAGIYIYLYFKPYAEYRMAVAASDWPVAAKHLNTIRVIVGTNLIIGLITVFVAASGRFW